MKIVMSKTKYLVDCLQKEDIDTSASIHLMATTKVALVKIRSDGILNEQITKCREFCTQYDIDPDEEFSKVHRKRKVPKRLDDNPETAADLSLEQFAAKETFQMLDRMIQDLSLKIEQVSKTFESFLIVLQPVPKFDDNLHTHIEKISECFPTEIPDVAAFETEYYAFCALFQDKLQEDENFRKTISCASKLCYEQLSAYNLFPSVYKLFKLFLSAPPSVCSSERSFSRLKLLKSYLRNKMSQERLQNLMLISNEADISSSINLDDLTKKWATMKKRRIMI